MQMVLSTTGILGEFASFSSIGTRTIARTGQCASHAEQFTPSSAATQRSGCHTAWPTWIVFFSAGVMRRIAPAGHTSPHFTHSGRQ